MAITFVVRQRVQTVKKSWLEVVESGTFERPISDSYWRLVAEHPAEYFEFVRVETSEDCLAFTPLAD